MRASETHKPRYLAWMANLGLALISITLVLGLAEAVLRYGQDTDLAAGTHAAQMDIPQDSLANAVTEEEDRAFRWDEKGDGLLHIRSDNRRMVFEMRPNVHLNEFVSTNSDGFRDREFSQEKAKNTFRIAAVGDSITFGWFQRLEQTYPKVVESLLNAQAAPGTTFEVYNFGIGCYNVEQEVALVKDRVFRYQPDLLFVQYCSNDGLIGVDSGLYGHFMRGKTRLGDLACKAWLRWRERDQGRFLLEDSYRELLAYVKERQIPALVMVVPTNCDANDQVGRDTAMLRRLGFNVLALSDAYSALPAEQLFADPCVHPNSLGSRIAAEELLQRLCSDASLGAADRLKGALPNYAQARLDLRAGLDSVQANRPDTAAEAYGRAVSLVPEYGPYAANSLAKNAVDPFAKHSPAEALRLMRLAASWDPKRPEHALGTARLQAALGQREEALQTCRQSILLCQKQPVGAAASAGLANAYYEMGQLLRDKPDQQAAAFREALELAGRLKEPFEGLERHYRELGDTQGCVAEFNRFVEKHPDSLLGKYYLVRALIEAKYPDEAERIVKAAFGQDSQSRIALLAEAELACARGNCTRAGETLRVLFYKDPNDETVYGHMLADTPCLNSAYFSALWDEFARRLPDRALVQFNVGQFEMKRHHWSEARRAFARILEQDPTNEGALYAQSRASLGEAEELLGGGNLKEALLLAQEAGQISPNDKGVQDRIAELSARLGNSDEAKRVYRENIIANPKDISSYGRLSGLYTDNSDWQGLRREWGELAPRLHNESLGWFHLALACERLTDMEAARNAAERAVILNPQDTGANNLLAEIYVQQARPLLETGQEAACAALLDKSLRLNGRRPEALCLSACFAEARGDLHLAREIYRDIIKAASSEDFRPYMLLSQTYDETADKEAIVAEWQFMVCACPADYLVHYNLGLALDRIGDSAAAREAYRTILALRPDAPDSLVLPNRIRKN